MTLRQHKKLELNLESLLSHIDINTLIQYTLLVQYTVSLRIDVDIEILIPS